MQNLASVFRDDMLTTHVDELEQLWSGKPQFVSQTVNYTLDGRRLDVLLKAVILPGHEDTLGPRARHDRGHHRTRRRCAARAAAERALCARALRAFAGVAVGRGFQLRESTAGRCARARHRRFRTFTNVHPEFVERCMQEIHVLDVNQHTLRMFAAPDKATLLARLSDVFRDDMQQHFQEQLIDLWDTSSSSSAK